MFAEVATSQQSPITDLSQHHPAFYHAGTSAVEDEPLQLGTQWPGEECTEEDIFPGGMPYMHSQEEVSAAAATRQASSLDTTTINLPVHGQVTLTGTVQLRLPQKLAQCVVTSQSGLTTAMMAPSAATSASAMVTSFLPQVATAKGTIASNSWTSSPGEPARQSSVTPQQQLSWAKKGQRWYSLDELGGASIAVGGRPEQRSTARQSAQRHSMASDVQREENEEQAMHYEDATDDVLFMHMTELQEEDSEAWTVLDQPQHSVPIALRLSCRTTARPNYMLWRLFRLTLEQSTT
eukprot:631516-Amphidinium_carterae.1